MEEDKLVDLEILPGIPSNMSWATEIYHETCRQDDHSSVDTWSHEVQSTELESCWEIWSFVLGKIFQAYHPQIGLLRTVFWDMTRCSLVI